MEFEFCGCSTLEFEFCDGGNLAFELVERPCFTLIWKRGEPFGVFPTVF